MLKRKKISVSLPILKKVPYRTFLDMPAKLAGVPMFYTVFFSLGSLNAEHFSNLFLSSPKRYEKKSVEGVFQEVKNFRQLEKFYKTYWHKLSDEEKIAYGLILLHANFSSWLTDGIYEIMIDCPPSGFNVESQVSVEKLPTLEIIKKKSTAAFMGADKDIYDFIEKIMKELAVIISKNREIVKAVHRREMRRIMSFTNFYELMQNSILQLLYSHPGVSRFQKPVSEIFFKNIGHSISKPKKYYLFPKKERRGLVGLSASPGKVVGVAVVYNWLNSAHEKIKKGNILVCPKTDPAWVSLMRKVSGVITESGGVLSHAAIVARELGIPCIVGLFGAMKKIKSGDLLKMDADRGTVKIIKKK
ncbi:MAG: PEP-utilizing enzyme [Parcubacteria group bacterium]|jgi:phosphohistidine swiveling domain-containing protein